MEVSLIIPCYNEEGNIEQLVTDCLEYLSNPKHELILVNNGSSDKTEDKIDLFLNQKNITKVNVKKNVGFGFGVISGLQESKGSLLIYTHADEECDRHDILRGIELYHSQNSNSRFILKGHRVKRLQNNWTISDIIFSVCMGIFESLVFRIVLNDIHAQPVFFDKKFFHTWKKPPDDFLLDLYVMLMAKKQKFQIIRFPVFFNKKGRKYGLPNNDTMRKKILVSFVRIASSFRLLLRMPKEFNEDASK